MKCEHITKIMYQAAKDPRLLPRDTQVLLMLSEHCKGQQYTNLSLHELAKIVQSCLRTVQYSYERLQRFSYIATERVDGVLKTRLLFKSKATDKYESNDTRLDGSGYRAGFIIQNNG